MALRKLGCWNHEACSQRINHDTSHSISVSYKLSWDTMSHTRSREVDFMTWFPVSFLSNGVYVVTHAGFELKVPFYDSAHLTTTPQLPCDTT